MKKGKGENDRSSVKDSSGSGVRVNYKVVSIVVVVLLLLFLVFVFNRGGDSEDDGWGSLFSFRIDSDPFPFPFPLPDLEFGPESDSDPESDSNPESDSGCPREGDDEGLTQICNRALEADDAENEFICCKESQECDTTEDGEPSCNDGLPEGEEGSYCENDNEPEGPITCSYKKIINGIEYNRYWCCPEAEPYCVRDPNGGQHNTCEADQLFPDPEKTAYCGKDLDKCQQCSDCEIKTNNDGVKTQHCNWEYVDIKKCEDEHGPIPVF